MFGRQEYAMSPVKSKTLVNSNRSDILQRDNSVSGPILEDIDECSADEKQLSIQTAKTPQRTLKKSTSASKPKALASKYTNK
jgi:hypothetical protein